MKDKIKVLLGKLKAFLVRFGKKFKDNWLKVLCLLVAIFVCSCAWLSSCSRSRKDSTLQASADIIPSDYAFNIYPSVYPDIANDSRFTVDEDGTIHITGVFDTLFTANMPRFDIENNVSYYFYGKSSVNSVYIYAYINDNGVSTAYTDNVFSCTNVVNPAKFTLQVGRGTYDNLIIRPVFARSTVPVPWTPSVSILQDDSYDSGYSSGYDVGNQEGYQEGYQAGLNVYKYGWLYDSYVRGAFLLTSGGYEYFALPFDYSTGSLSNVSNYINENYTDLDFTKFYLTLFLTMPISAQNLDFRLVFHADISLILDSKIYLEDAEGYTITDTFNWVLENDYFVPDLPFSTYSIDDVVTKFEFTINDLSVLNKMRFYGINPAYNVAYDNGFSAGYNESQFSISSQLQSQYDNGYKLGQEKGFNEGYSKGHTIGYNEGRDVTEQGYTFVSLIDAVGYGVTKPFVSLLNFDLLGVNLLSFATGLLTLVLMIKLVGIFI